MSNAYLSAREAAAELNVSRATLYAYVSRGLIRSEPAETGRHRLYRADDVRNLRGRKSPAATTEQILARGAPVLDSAITYIDDGRFYYRGRDALRLSSVASLESVAGLLWNCGERDPFETEAIPVPQLPKLVSPYARMQAALSIAAPQDLKALNLQPWGVACTGARILRLLVAAITSGDPEPGPIHEQLARAWGVSHAAAAVIRVALVLCADHELNVSAFAVRCIASARSTPYAAVLAGLAALQGPRHGGVAERAAALFDDVTQNGENTVVDRLRRGEHLPGFGQFLYPDGDPRCVAIMRAVDEYGFKGPARDMAVAIETQARHLTDLEPNIDFGLATLQRALHLPDIAAPTIFAIGRCVGWIAHAQEQYQNPELIRPRARYVGEKPQPAHRR